MATPSAGIRFQHWAPEIARELSVSVTTVRTHIRHLFVKLGAHGRSEAVTQARALGLLAPSPSTP